ncbi:MAG: TadE/TadG family type IV pilus assembly protein [Parvularculaceae bacterium]
MRLGKNLRSLSRCRSGAQAVEFAIIAPVLFAFIFGVFEVGRLTFEQNRVAAAAAAGARAVSLYGGADTVNITAAINGKLPYQAQISLTDTSLGGQSFKKIDVTYDFDFLIKFSKDWSGVTITATRYAPALS